MINITNMDMKKFKSICTMIEFQLKDERPEDATSVLCVSFIMLLKKYKNNNEDLIKDCLTAFSMTSTIALIPSLATEILNEVFSDEKTKQ